MGVVAKVGAKVVGAKVVGAGVVGARVGESVGCLVGEHSTFKMAVLNLSFTQRAPSQGSMRSLQIVVDQVPPPPEITHTVLSGPE